MTRKQKGCQSFTQRIIGECQFYARSEVAETLLTLDRYKIKGFYHLNHKYNLDLEDSVALALFTITRGLSKKVGFDGI